MIKKFLFITLVVLTLFPIINANAITIVDCGNITQIPKKIPDIVSLAVKIIQVAVPVILVLMGSIDLLKAVAAQKEDDVKKGRQILIKRIIVAFVIFFVIAIVKFVASVVADSASKDNIVECIDCFLSGSCKNERRRR